MNRIKGFCASKKNGEKCGNTAMDNNKCYEYNSKAYPYLNDFYDSFPTLTFHFGEPENHSPYELRGRDYLYKWSDDSNKYCIGIEAFG